MTNIKILPIMYVPNTAHGTDINSFKGCLKDKNGNPSESINDKILKLNEVFIDIKTSDRYSNFFKTHPKDSLAILTLPEYFFNLNSFPSTEKELEKTLFGLAGIMPRNENILFVAGTIPWYKVENNVIKIYICAPVFYKGKLIFATSKLKNKDDNRLSQSARATREVGLTKNNWGFYVGRLSGIDKDTQKSRNERIEKLNRHNQEFNEKFELKNSHFIELPVGKQKLKIGLEICADHLLGRLVQDKNVPELDVQIVISCGATLKKSSVVVSEGGYFILCDGASKSRIGVYKCTKNMKLSTSRDYNLRLKSLMMQREENDDKIALEKDQDKKNEKREEKKKLTEKYDDLKKMLTLEFTRRINVHAFFHQHISLSSTDNAFHLDCQERFEKPRFFQDMTISIPEKSNSFLNSLAGSLTSKK